jgi:hypothetical protein
LHRLSSAVILGYHGCDRTVAERLLRGEPFIPSANEYDWLGHGIYFWEANPKRGLDFAQQLKERPRGSSKVQHPAVVGAVIDLGLCLDLTTTAGIEHIKSSHTALVEIVARADPPRKLPENSSDGLRRKLDCAVVNLLHDIVRQSGEAPFDTVKGIFVEGEPIYVGSGFHERTHIQVCVRNPEAIKGVFRIPKPDIV